MHLTFENRGKGSVLVTVQQTGFPSEVIYDGMLDRKRVPFRDLPSGHMNVTFLGFPREELLAVAGALLDRTETCNRIQQGMAERTCE